MTDITAGRMVFEVEMLDASDATIHIDNLNLRMGALQRQTQYNELGLNRFLSSAQVGWAALGITAGTALKEVAEGSSFLSSALGAPGELLNSVGMAIDVAFPDEFADFQQWLAETQNKIINIGVDIGESENKIERVGQLLGELTGKTLKVGIDLTGDLIQNIPEISSRLIDLTSGALEGLGLNEGTSDVVGGAAVAALERQLVNFLADRAGAYVPELVQTTASKVKNAAFRVGPSMAGQALLKSSWAIGDRAISAGAAASRLIGALNPAIAAYTLMDIGSQPASGSTDPSFYLADELGFDESFRGGGRPTDEDVIFANAVANMVHESAGGQSMRDVQIEAIVRDLLNKGFVRNPVFGSNTLHGQLPFIHPEDVEQRRMGGGVADIAQRSGWDYISFKGDETVFLVPHDWKTKTYQNR